MRGLPPAPHRDSRRALLSTESSLGTPAPSRSRPRAAAQALDADAVAANVFRPAPPGDPLSLNDLDIARSVPLRPLTEIARVMGLQQDDLLPYGLTKAKVKLDQLAQPPTRKQG